MEDECFSSSQQGERGSCRGAKAAVTGDKAEEEAGIGKDIHPPWCMVAGLRRQSRSLATHTASSSEHCYTA